MRIFATELKKLLSGRIFLLIAAVALVLNAYLMFRTANNSEQTPEEYKAIYSELEGMDDGEKLQWLEARSNEFSGQHNFDLYILYELWEECGQIVGYQEYLDSIDSQAKAMSSISIFAKPDTFNYRSIMKTPPAYEHMGDVQPVFDVSKGINLATDNNFTDILIGFIVLFAVISLMISDREQGLSGLLFPLKRGRGYLLLTKMGVLAVTVFATILLMYGENLIIGGQIYGLGDLSRPVQSLDGFIGCNLKISVLSYLFLYIAFKFAAIFTIGAVLSLIAVNTKNTVSFYGISAITLAVEGLTFALIHPLSKYSIFRYINLIAFTRGNDIFCNFKNINFWGYPVPLIPTSIGAIIIISLICTALTVWLYSVKRNLEYRKISIRLGFTRSEKIHSKLYYTLYKSLILQKGIVFIAVFIAVAGFMSTSFIKKYDPVDAYYQYYCNRLEGEITQETLDFIESESARFAEINARIEELSQAGVFSSEMSQLQKDITPQIGFIPFSERVSQIKDIDGAQIFYDTGYKRALGMAGYDDDMKYSLAAVLLCIFLVSPLIANDNRHKMSFVINATASGKRSYIRRNILTACMYGMLSALLWIVPYAVTLSLYYKHSGLGASLRSITDFIDFPLNITVWQYLLLVSLLRILFTALSALVMLGISSQCRNASSAVLVNFAVFALPIIIYLLGAEFMVNIGFNPLLSVNAVLNEASVVQFAVPFGVAAVLVYRVRENNYASR